MYQTIEERIAYLENIIDKQAFQIELLQQIASQQKGNPLYPLIISSNMSKKCFDALKKMTYNFENKLEHRERISLRDYIDAFELILRQDGVYLGNSALADIIPKWLAEFSSTLHIYFYR